MKTALLIFFVLEVVFSCFLLALTRNLIHAAFTLFAVLFGVAGMYVIALGPFIAMMQIVIYVGGILVIILFGIMLTQKLKDLKPTTGLSNVLPALLGMGAMGAALGYMIYSGGFKFEAVNPGDDVKRLGVAILTDYLLLFELVSILLLAVLIGAAYLARKEAKA